MKVVFFSNFLNHHQAPFCEEMVKRLGKDFVFVATTPIPSERKNMGYYDFSSVDYVFKSYESKENKEIAIRLAEDADVVIWGDAPIEFFRPRLKKDLLTFKYSERYFKKGKWRIFDPRVFINLYKNNIRYRKNKNLYLLCASAYTAPDCKFIGCYIGKAYKWGYFPTVKKYENVDTLISEKKKNSILWAGRFIGWKHPEIAINIAKKLKKDGYDFSLDLIGVGKKENYIKRKIDKFDLNDKVKLLGVMSPDKVRENMEKAGIFLFTSNRQEGWGAVLNESMNSACAVVASKEIGSVPYLIKDGENGFTYKNKRDLYKKVKYLLDNNEKREEMGKKAYETLAETWNAETAAERLLALIDNIKNGKNAGFTCGPCSKG